MDTSVKPGDNFDRFVNGTWAKNNKIPADKASYGAFDMLYDKSQKDVKAIIEEASKEVLLKVQTSKKLEIFIALIRIVKTEMLKA